MGDQPTEALELDRSDLVELGEIVGTHGVRGCVRLRLFNPDSRVLEKTDEVFLSKEGENLARHELVSARRSRDFMLVKLREANDPEEARRFVGCKLLVRKALLPVLGDREYYHYQLQDLEVVSRRGHSIGRVRRVLATQGQDLLVVNANGKEYMIPLVEEIVPQIDLAGRRIVVADITGLLD